MTDQIAPAPLPGKASTTRPLSFRVPHILKAITLDPAGFRHPEVREGGFRQIDHETVVEYTEEPVTPEDTFLIRATNQINLAGSKVDVINNEVLLDDGFRLVPTSPTAAEYFALVGQKVLIHFDSIRLLERNLPPGWEKERPLYRTVRIFITLP